MGTMTETNRYVKLYRHRGENQLDCVINQDCWFGGEAKYADIILPACTNLERNDLGEWAVGGGYTTHAQIGNNWRVIVREQKCVEPLGESKTDYEIFQEVAKKLGLWEEYTDGGKTEDECAKWMDETNWWTATEAKEKGFVDEVDDDAEYSVVENRNGVLFVNSISMNTPFNEAPNFVRSRVTDNTATRPENMNPAEKPERNDHGEVKNMDIKTTDDLRKAYPDLVASIENEATTAERTRIQEIENATLPGAEDQANEAKFTKPVDSASFAKAVIASMKAKQQEQSKKYLKNAKEAAENSNANSIDNTPPANPEAEDEESKAFMNAIRKANGVK